MPKYTIVEAPQWQYVAKMLKIPEDRSKFKQISSVTDCDRTARIETSLQDLLRSLHKAGEMDDTTYENIRPTDAIHPRM